MYDIYVSPCSELYHYGIEGMKWGVRRYQNPDGTLTEAGKKRYGSSYKSLATKRYEYRGDTDTNAYKRSVELDRKIGERYSNYNEGSDIKKQLLIGGPSSINTYEMSRATGRGKLNSWLRSQFDISIAGFIKDSTMREASSFIDAQNGKLAKEVAGSMMAPAYSFGGSDGGYGAPILRDPSLEMTAQQRWLRNNYTSKGSMQEQKAAKEAAREEKRRLKREKG